MSDHPESVRLDDVLITEELSRRPPRPPDWEAENRVMRSLARQLAGEPEAILQSLADRAVDLCNADAAGISAIETRADGGEVFRPIAIAGSLAPHPADPVPRRSSPWGVCLERGAPVLFSRPERYFADLPRTGRPRAEELVLPLIAEERAIGAIWIVTHDGRRRFDSEDARLMAGLADFAAATLLRSRRQVGELRATRTVLEAETAERKLAEGRTLALIENLPGGAVFVVDRDLRYRLAEGEALRVAGFAPGDLVGRTIFDVLSPELAADYEKRTRA